MTKPNFLKDTAGSKTKKQYGRKRAYNIMTQSKEKSLASSHEQFRDGIFSAKSSHQPVESKDIDDITRLADEFWNKLETEKAKYGEDIGGTSSGVSPYNSVEKPVVKTPQTTKVHISQKSTFSQKMKNNQLRGSVDRFKNRHFYDKFRHSNYNKM